MIHAKIDDTNLELKLQIIDIALKTEWPGGAKYINLVKRNCISAKWIYENGLKNLKTLPGPGTKFLCGTYNIFKKYGIILNLEGLSDFTKKYILDKSVYLDEKENISREYLVKNVETIFGSIDNFLDIIEEDLPYGYDLAKSDEEIYLIDCKNNNYINWYKLTHVGRDLHTNMNSKEDINLFLQRLKLMHELYKEEK